MAEKAFEDLGKRDDWLAKELAREKRISAWDLDETRKVRESHEENCDVRAVADEHHEAHVKSDQFISLLREKKQGKRANTTTGKDISWFIALTILMFVLFFVTGMLPFDAGMLRLPAIIAFLAINPGIFIWLLLVRRFPAAWYSRTVFWIVLLSEIMLILTQYRNYLYFLLRRFF